MLNHPVKQPTEKPSLAEALRAARDTRWLELGSGVLGRVPEVFRQQFGDKTALLVADTNTFAAAGKAVLAVMRHAGIPCREPFIFTDPKLYAEHSFVVALEEALKGHEAIPVAVGSGTINDLSKLAAHRAGRPYMSVATAASMDGYTAFGASITFEGSKQTFFCPAPVAVVADIEIIRAAPEGMNASGYADMLAKTTAGADWIIANALGIEPMHPQAWRTAQGSLRDALADPEGVRKRDLEAMRRLTEGLMLGGFAMQCAQSSRPASGAEHQFSHLWDMSRHAAGEGAGTLKPGQRAPGNTLKRGQPASGFVVHALAGPPAGMEERVSSHGFQVGIGTMAVAALYEYLLAQKLEDVNIEKCCEQWPDEAGCDDRVREMFGEGRLREIALKETRAKWVDAGGLRKQLEKLTGIWPELRILLREQLIPFAELKRMLRTAGAPAEPEQIGISRERLRESFRQAVFIRRRFTVLDVAVRCGVLEPALDQIFGPAGPWPVTERDRRSNQS